MCDEKNFQRDGFSNLTVILCDGCEREYHIKCLQEHRNVNLDCLPEGKHVLALKIINTSSMLLGPHHEHQHYTV